MKLIRYLHHNTGGIEYKTRTDELPLSNKYSLEKAERMKDSLKEREITDNVSWELRL